MCQIKLRVRINGRSYLKKSLKYEPNLLAPSSKASFNTSKSWLAFPENLEANSLALDSMSVKPAPWVLFWADSSSPKYDDDEIDWAPLND